jgi:hypothetical protein
VPGATDSRERRKEELRLLARIERAELALHLREFRRLERPANFALIGARIFRAWRSPAWLGSAVALLAARGKAGNVAMRAVRYAFLGFAAWRTWRLLREYAGKRRPHVPPG